MGNLIDEKCSELFRDQPNIVLLRDVIYNETFYGAKRLVRRIRKEYGVDQEGTKSSKSTNRFIAVIWHPEKEEIGHIHVYHSCVYSQSHCRCVFLKNIKNIKRRNSRRITPINTIKAEDWTCWLQYFFKPPRDLLHLQIANISLWGDVFKLKRLRQSFRYEERDCIQRLENSIFSQQDCSRESSSSESEEVQGDQEISREVRDTTDSRSEGLPGFGGKSRINPKAQLVAMLIENMRMLLCVPFESSSHCTLWVNNPHLFLYDNSNNEYRLACNSLSRMTSNLNFNQLIDLHNNASHPVYYARDIDHYYTVEESLKFVEELLFFQYNNEENVKEFITKLFNVCERVLPKKNSMFIHGRPNSGKSWFFDMIQAFYLNVGHIKNLVRGNNFPFNDCINRRILIWNEPNIMPSGFDTVKMIAGGDPCPVAVKYQGDSTISRTPLIFTSNNKIFNISDVWTSRIFFETWHPAGFLKDCNKRPHPLVFPILYNKYYNK